MWSASLLTLLIASPPTGFTSSVERIPLVRQGTQAPTLVLDAMAGRIFLNHIKPRAPFNSLVCPTSEKTPEGVVLSCATRRLWASLYQDQQGAYLDLRVLRGLPRDPELSVGVRAWPMRAVGIPDDCPGRLDITRAECLLAEGKHDEAEAGYRKARGGPDANLAYLRLGDLAAERGELESAMHLYAFVPAVGPIGRIARARLCDITGSCMEERDSLAVGNTDGLPELIKSELELMTWRREALCGREAGIMGAFAQTLQTNPEVCERSMTLCQRLLLAGLTAADDGSRSAALDGWLVESVRRGPFEYELAIAASRAAESLGAPGFAAAVLASSAAWVTRGDLAEHLLKIVQLYLAGRDPVRSAVILDYAEQRLGLANTQRGAWAQARADLARAQRPEPVRAAVPEAASATPAFIAEVDLARELARAATARSRASSEGGR